MLGDQFDVLLKHIIFENVIELNETLNETSFKF